MYKTEETKVFDTELLKVGTVVKVTNKDKIYNGIIIKSTKNNLDVVTIKKFDTNKSRVVKSLLECFDVDEKDFEEKTKDKYIPEILSLCNCEECEQTKIEIIAETFIND